jgi:DNA mismatch repair ATPase MutS
MFEPGETNDLAASIYEYVNLLFLLDVNAFVFAIESLRASQPAMRRMFDAIGILDTAQSVAQWRASLPQWTAPEFTDPKKALHADSVVHPLLTAAVPNSLDIQATGVLITGSNMSGKTTFVRTLGVNAVLAQTVHTACAASWRAPMLRTRTSIERGDSVMEGKSYYLAEVEAVRGLIRAKAPDRQYLFLLDEIFRGTNTTERVAGAYGVLAYLNRGIDLVVVATHDVELLDLLGSAFAPVHFREQITDGGLTFDYRIHSGPSSTRNAIALLELMEFPRDVVRDALSAIKPT